MSESAQSDTAATPEVQSWHVPRLVIAWAVALVVGVCAAVLAPAEERSAWLVLALGVATLVTFALQLGTAQREGFISRVSFSVAGAVLIIAVIAGVALLL